MEIQVPGFSNLHSPLTQTHPIFQVPLHKLLPYVPQYFQGNLSSEESYLLYLSLWNKTEKITFRTPAKLSQKTPGIIARTIDDIVSIVQNIQHINLELPQIIIDSETADFESSADWLSLWDQCFQDHKDKYKTATALQKLAQKESTLERYIKDPTKDISSYAHQLALWASDAGEFPQHSAGLDKNVLGGQEMSLASYWRYLIKACCISEHKWEIPQDVFKADLQELIEHCEEFIPHGSIYANELMSLLRSGQDKVNNYLDIGDVDVGLNGTVFRILNKDASVEDAAKLALIDSAPKSKPVEADYPNKLAFLKAKMNWNLAEDYRKSGEIQAMLDEAEKNIANAKENKK